MAITVSEQSSVGFVGYIKDLTSNNRVIRASSCDLKLSQEINKPDNIVTGRYDKILYWPGPRIVEGTVEFPAVNVADFNGAVCSYWNKARCRASGALTPIDLGVRYTNGTAFIYTKCIINEFTFSVTQQDLINIRLGLIGADRTPWDQADVNNGPLSGVPGIGTGIGGAPITNERVLTWADFVVSITVAGSVLENTGTHLRSFTSTINNNAERVYVLNSTLSPIFVIPKVRDFTGSFETLGRFDQVSDWAADNQTRCSEESIIKYGFNPCNNVGGNSSSSSVVIPDCGDCGTSATVNGFGATLNGVIFQIEEINLTNDIFVTTVNWHAMPDQMGQP